MDNMAASIRIRGKYLFKAKALTLRTIKQRSISVLWLLDFCQPCQAVQPNLWLKVLYSFLIQ